MRPWLRRRMADFSGVRCALPAPRCTWAENVAGTTRGRRILLRQWHRRTPRRSGWAQARAARRLLTLADPAFRSSIVPAFWRPEFLAAAPLVFRSLADTFGQIRNCAADELQMAAAVMRQFVREFAGGGGSLLLQRFLGALDGAVGVLTQPGLRFFFVTRRGGVDILHRGAGDAAGQALEFFLRGV